jgi:hypothetical protein
MKLMSHSRACPANDDAEEKGKVDDEYLHGMHHLRRILEDLYKQESLVGASTAGGIVATTLERRRGRRRSPLPEAQLEGEGDVEPLNGDDGEGLLDSVVSGSFSTQSRSPRTTPTPSPRPLTLSSPSEHDHPPPSTA